MLSMTATGMGSIGMEDCAFEAVTLLPGFARLSKRSGELDGNETNRTGWPSSCGSGVPA